MKLIWDKCDKVQELYAESNKTLLRKKGRPKKMERYMGLWMRRYIFKKIIFPG